MSRVQQEQARGLGLGRIPYFTVPVGEVNFFFFIAIIYTPLRERGSLFVMLAGWLTGCSPQKTKYYIYYYGEEKRHSLVLL